MEDLIYINWEMILVQDMELWEVLLIAFQMDKFLEILRVQLWGSHLVQNTELREVLLMVSKLGI